MRNGRDGQAKNRPTATGHPKGAVGVHFADLCCPKMRRGIRVFLARRFLGVHFRYGVRYGVQFCIRCNTATIRDYY